MPGDYGCHTPFRPGHDRDRLFYWLDTYVIHVWFFGGHQDVDSTATVAAGIGRTVYVPHV